MKSDEARELLSSSLPKEEVLAQYKALSDLAGRLGEWAQLLKLVNGFLRERVNEGGERLREHDCRRQFYLRKQPSNPVVQTEQSDTYRSIELSILMRPCVKL